MFFLILTLLCVIVYVYETKFAHRVYAEEYDIWAKVIGIFSFLIFVILLIVGLETPFELNNLKNKYDVLYSNKVEKMYISKIEKTVFIKKRELIKLNYNETLIEMNNKMKNKLYCFFTYYSFVPKKVLKLQYIK